MPRRAERGFTLVEALVALAILAVASLVGLATLLAEGRIERRLAARAEAMRAVEATLEGVRAGTVPLRSGPLPAAPAAAGGGQPPVLWLEVVPTATADLYEVRATARYAVLGEERRWQAQTLVWAP